MSDHGERPRDPDPAALAELQRAFGEDDDESVAADNGASAMVTERIDALPADDTPARATEVDPQASVTTSPLDEVVADRSVVPESAIITTRIDQVTPAVPGGEPVPDDSGNASDGEQIVSGPAILDPDQPDVEPLEDGESVDVVIVEQEPGTEPEPAGSRIIRIDDYSGSAPVGTEPAPGEFDDATPEALAADTPASPTPSEVPNEASGSPVTISISDDEFPDAVYVEGSLDREGGGSIVIIEDDDTGDALEASSERALRRGIEPRMRERRLAVKRAQGRKRLKVLLTVAGAVLAVVLTIAALGTFFVVREDNVVVFNAVYTDEDELQEIIDEVVGTPVLLVDTTDVEERIEEIPWVDRATVRTDFPHGLVIEIRERAAIVTYQGPDGRFRVLDRDGRVLDVLDLYPYAYVLVGGPDTVDLEAGEFAPQGYAAAAELAKNLTPTVRGRVTLIEVNSDGSRLVMYLDDGSTVFFGEARDLLAKLVRLETVLTNGQDREPGLIDISTSDVTR